MTGRARPRVFEVDPARPETFAEAVIAVARALEEGGLAILPTETVYGLAARPDLPRATARVFEAKRRPSGLNLPVLAPDPDAAWRAARRTPLATSLAARFWPGGLTLVLDRTDAALAWSLGEERHTVAVRVPDHPVVLALLRRTGPLATTSANRSGEPPLADPARLVETFRADVAVFVLLAPATASPGGVASTVVDARGPDPVILRTGAIPQEAVVAASKAG